MERNQFTLSMCKKFEYLKRKCVQYATLFCELTQEPLIRHKLLTLEY
jgi:hypothetical protein